MPAQKLPFNYVFLACCLVKINKAKLSHLSEQKQQHHVTDKPKNKTAKADEINLLRQLLTLLIFISLVDVSGNVFKDAHYNINTRTEFL